MKYVLAALLCFGGAAASAAPISYNCTFPPSRDGTISGQITVTVDPDTRRAAIRDSITQSAVGGAVPARFRQRRNAHFEASWNVDGVRAGRGGGQLVRWSIDINPSDNSAVMRARWDRVGDTDESRRPTRAGQCQRVSVPNLLG
ncbi:MAG: hypothetical protein AAGF56_14385 [Pseudomonadota bacterium]